MPSAVKFKPDPAAVSRWSPSGPDSRHRLLQRELKPAPELEKQPATPAPVQPAAGGGATRRMLVGLDLGADRTTVHAAFPGVGQLYLNRTLATVVGYDESTKSGNSEQVCAEEALLRARELRIVRPWQDGVLRDPAAARDFLRHVAAQLERRPRPEIRAVIPVTMDPDGEGRSELRALTRGLFDEMLFLPRPYLTALGLRIKQRTFPKPPGGATPFILVDMGAGTTDFCLADDNYPGRNRQQTLKFGGDQTDGLIAEAVRRQKPGFSPTRDQVRGWKDQFGFAGESAGRVLVKVAVLGEELDLDLTGALQTGCEVWVMRVVSTLQPMIERCRKDNGRMPEIRLAGGGSRMSGLEEAVQTGLSRILGEEIAVSVVRENAKHLTAAGALFAARQAREEQWRRFE